MKIAATNHLLCSKRMEEILSSQVGRGVALYLWVVIKCGRNIREHRAAPIKLKPPNNPKSFNMSEVAYCRLKNPRIVVALPMVNGNERSAITFLRSPVWR